VDAGCNRCVADCPVNAITLVDREPMLAEATCVRCGVCLHSCPTGVFHQPKEAEGQLIEATRPLTEQSVALVCALHPTPNATAAPVATIVQHRRCLAALAVDQLLALSADGVRPIWLDDGPCATCPLSATQESLQQRVASANALLQAFGRQASLILQSEQEVSTTEPERRPLIDAGNPPVGRRGLLAALGRTIGAQGSELRTATAESTDMRPLASVRLPQQIPSQRRALQGRLQQWPLPSHNVTAVADLPYAAVTINPAHCSACGLCARFCPTGALQFTTEGDHFTLSFRAAICIDCRLCTVACPEHAIHLDDSLAVAALVNEEWLPVVTGQLMPCAQCDVPTVTTAAQAEESTPVRCYSCRQGAGLVQPLRDEAGLMADLLRQLPQTALAN
jgi:MinD superfamily P-loop ATPase